MTSKIQGPAFIPCFDLGIGVHYGSIIFGAVGLLMQKNLTVLSDTVNTAARIESVTRDTQGMIVASERVHPRMRDSEIVHRANYAI